MAALNYKMDMRSAASRMTLNVEVTGRARFALCLWLGVRLIRLAAWIIGCNIEIAGPAKTA